MADRPGLDGFWWPGGRGDLELREEKFGPGRVPLRVPVLTPAALREQLIELKVKGRRLAERPSGSILEPIEEASRRLVDPDGDYRDELLERLPGLTGYSREMIAIGLDRMAAGWTAAALRAALEGELGDTGVLDGFRPRRPGGRHRAYGPELTVHIFSGNIPGVSVTSLIRALCVKSPSLGKTAAGEPYLAVCFARALAEVDADLADCLAVTYWTGGSRELESVAFSEAEVVVGYGNDRTISDVRSRLPAHVRFLGYPNRLGAALISRSALRGSDVDATAERAARDVVTFDQQGCVSPHIIYVEEGGEVGADDFARRLAAALDQLAGAIPRGHLTPGESTQVHQLRAQAEMRGAMVLASDGSTEWTVILERRLEFEPSPLNRVIYVRPVRELREAVAPLADIGRHLQTVAIAGEREVTDSLAGALGSCGVTRLVPLGEAAWPAPHWHHDGRFQFLDLLRFVDLET